MTRQGGINPILSQLSPSSSGQETVPERKGVWQREGLDVVEILWKDLSTDIP